MKGPDGDPLPEADDLAGALGVRVAVHGTVGSTMATAREDPGPLPAVHVAERQTAGRGRGGRTWESPPGNLHATIAWPDPAGRVPPAVLAAIQVAWADAVDRAGGPACRWKWPNDGYLGEGKWAGALAVRAGDRLLVGLGANLTRAPDLPPGGPRPAALAERWSPWPGRGRVVPLLLGAALEVLRDAPARVPAALARWPERDALAAGRAVTLATPTGPRTGRYLGVAPDGRLRLEGPAGEERHAAGDVRALRPAG